MNYTYLDSYDGKNFF